MRWTLGRMGVGRKTAILWAKPGVVLDARGGICNAIARARVRKFLWDAKRTSGYAF